MIAPGALGASAGTLLIGGDYTQSSNGGKLHIELASLADVGKLAVSGNMTLGGTLEIWLAEDFVPHGARSFDVLDWGGGLSGELLTINLPTPDGTPPWDTSELYTTGEVTLLAALVICAARFRARLRCAPPRG